MLRKDGSIAHVEINSSLCEDDPMPHTRCFIRDVTERKLMEQKARQLEAEAKEKELQVQQMAAESQEKTRDKDRMQMLCSNVAHDLLTPLLSFSLGLDELTQSCEANEVSDIEVLRMLASSAAFMKHTINRYLDYSKSSSGIELKPSLTSFDLSLSLRQAAGLVAAQNTSHIIDTVCDVSDPTQVY